MYTIYNVQYTLYTATQDLCKHVKLYIIQVCICHSFFCFCLCLVFPFSVCYIFYLLVSSLQPFRHHTRTLFNAAYRAEWSRVVGLRKIWVLGFRSILRRSISPSRRKKSILALVLHPFHFVFRTAQQNIVQYSTAQQTLDSGLFHSLSLSFNRLVLTNPLVSSFSYATACALTFSPFHSLTLSLYSFLPYNSTHSCPLAYRV